MASYYDTVTLITAIDEAQPFKSFLRDRYFPTDPDTGIFSTEKVLIELKDGRRRLAPAVMPRKGGISVEREKTHMREFIPPMIAPQRPITQDDLQKRQMGEALYGNRTPEEREAILMAQDLSELNNMITGREEYMAAQVLQTNGCILRQYADEYGSDEYEEWEVRFYDEEDNPALYIPSDSWLSQDSDWIDDLGQMARMLKQKGNAASEVLLGSNVFSALLKNEHFLKLMDNRRIHMGDIDPTEGSDGATYYGSIVANGTKLDLIGYDEEYEDEETGESKPFIDPDRVVLTAPNAGQSLYGAITQKEEDGQSYTYAATRVPKMLVNQENDSTVLKVRTRPILTPRSTLSWISSKVL